MPKLVVHLARMWPPDAPKDEQKDLWEEIKAGRKTSEFRDATEYWHDRIYKTGKDGITRPKVTRIWMVIGYPKGGLLPRLEADITNIIVHRDEERHVVVSERLKAPLLATQFEIQFENVVERR